MAYPGVILRLELTRQLTYYSLQLFIPRLMIVMLLLLMTRMLIYYVQPSAFHPQWALCHPGLGHHVLPHQCGRHQGPVQRPDHQPHQHVSQLGSIYIITHWELKNCNQSTLPPSFTMNNGIQTIVPKTSYLTFADYWLQACFGDTLFWIFDHKKNFQPSYL